MCNILGISNGIKLKTLGHIEGNVELNQKRYEHPEGQKNVSEKPQERLKAFS